MDIIGKISNVELIAKGNKIREYDRLNKKYGKARWRKQKGIAFVRLKDNTIVRAEVHWYEAHGKGRIKFKIKRILI